ncbi:MAG: hypothetical protein ACK5NE_06660 [Brachymonas sp.]
MPFATAWDDLLRIIDGFFSLTVFCGISTQGGIGKGASEACRFFPKNRDQPCGKPLEQLTGALPVLAWQMMHKKQAYVWFRQRAGTRPGMDRVFRSGSYWPVAIAGRAHRC